MSDMPQPSQLSADEQAAVRVVFFGNSQNVFSERFYRALCAADCKIVGLVDVPSAARSTTNPNAECTQLEILEDARRRGAEVLAPEQPNRPEVVDLIGSLAPDVFLAVGYTKLLKSELLSTPRVVAANVHASLLPAYRGKHPVFWALRHGERFSGLTIHAMDVHLDTGDILYQVQVRTRRNDTVAALYERIIEQGLPLVDRLVADAWRGRIEERPQTQEGASYFSGTTEEDFRIDWSRPAEQLRRWIVTTPAKCFTIIRGQQINFLDAEIVPNAVRTTAGTLLAMRRSGSIVATADGAIRLSRILDGTQSETTLDCFCLEAGLAVGDNLGMCNSN